MSDVKISESVSDPLVGGDDTTYVSSTDLPTDRPPTCTASLIKYYALRVTTPHADSDKIFDVFSQYSRQFLYCKHAADKEDSAEHFHAIFLDLTDRSIDALRKQLKKKFDRSGNGFLAGKWMDNTVYKAIQYFRHDEHAEASFRHRGSGWQAIIEASPEWDEIRPVPSSEPVAKKAKLSDPVLTHYNVVKQAIRHAHEHNIKSDNLAVVLEHMTRTTNWMPDIKILRTGLDPYHYKIFKYKMNGRTGPTPDWWSLRREAFHTDV